MLDAVFFVRVRGFVFVVESPNLIPWLVFPPLNVHFRIGHPLNPQLTTFHDALGGFFGIALQCWIRIYFQTHVLLGKHRHRPTSLLSHMSQLMRQNMLTLCRLGIVLS